ncbi:MAG: leucine-rich repeat domain-containing protein [Lachnospiraceae bacterium]|nr:leucine-rich repeat domain-containing protein [Lachnospiraceae bacterium]
MNEFTMWENKIVFKEGMFLYLDGKGNNSFICEECAGRIEADYYDYQASMDVNRGGIDPEVCYPGRGFVKGENGRWEYKKPYKIEKLKGEENVVPIEEEFTIPSVVDGTIKINVIRREAFYQCEALRKLVIPKSIKVIETGAFTGCTNLREIVVEGEIVKIEENAFLDTDYYNHEENWENGAIYLGGWLLKVRTETEGSFCVKEGTIGIADKAFEKCSKLTEIMMPETIDYIGGYAFVDCSNLTNISFPEKVKKFGVGVLSGCISLENVKLPTGVKNIAGMFKNNQNLRGAHLPEGIETIGNSAFENCTNLYEIRLPDSIKSISRTAFHNTGYMNEKANWKDGALYLSHWLIDVDKSLIGKFNIEDGTIGIADETFGTSFWGSGKSCALLTEIEIPETVKYIGQGAFCGCVKLKKIKIPSGVENLSQDIFRDCTNLKEVWLPKGIKSIGYWPFFRCEKVTAIVAAGSFAETYMKKNKIAYKTYED